jgi:hypothetical protein
MGWKGWLIVTRLRRGRNLSERGVDVDEVCGFEEVRLGLSSVGETKAGTFRSRAKRFKALRTATVEIPLDCACFCQMHFSVR